MGDYDGSIKRALGEDAIAHEYHIAGKPQTGWKKYIQSESGAPSDAAHQLVQSLWRTFHERDIRLLSGPTVYRVAHNQYADSCPESNENDESPPICAQVFALPNLPVVEIAEAFKVGTHNCAPDAFRAVREGLAEIAKIARFEVQFADPTGLHATFLTPIAPPHAADIAGIIRKIDPEGLERCSYELGQIGMQVPTQQTNPKLPDYYVATVKYITKTAKFKLWWS